MHQTSMKNMKSCVEKYATLLRSDRRLRVVDIGSLNVNGTYRVLFPEDRFEYIGIDMEPGTGVDLVITDPYKIPLRDGYADVVLSGQMLEHNEFFWLTFQEKVRIVNDDGFIFMIAPSTGPIHRYPVDCYRFYPDGYAALAKYTNSILIDCWMERERAEEELAWGDLVGVFVKTYREGLPRFDTGTIS